MRRTDIRKIGANTPTTAYVGSNPTANVAIENPSIVIIIDFFLPNLSPYIPKITDPRGLIIRVTVYDANVASMLKI